MTDIPNCSTCPNYQYRVVETEGEYCLVADEFIDNATDTIEKVGCLSHPQSREWLMKDVVEELKINFNNDRGIDYENTISLIRNGVKKE